MADAIRGEGGDAQAIGLDVTDVAAVRKCLAALPPFDILVNNAGTNRPKPMVEVTVEDYDIVDLLDRLADSSRAVSTYVRETEDIEAKVSSLYGKISNTVLAIRRPKIFTAVTSSESAALCATVTSR